MKKRDKQAGNRKKVCNITQQQFFRVKIASKSNVNINKKRVTSLCDWAEGDRMSEWHSGS